MSVFVGQRTLTGESSLGFYPIGSPILGNTANFLCTCLPYESGDYQWVVKNNPTDSDSDAISANFGTFSGGSVLISFPVSSPAYVVGNKYYFALEVSNGSTDIETIQVSFTVAQDGVQTAGTEIINFFTAQFTASGNPISVSNKVLDRDNFKQRYTPFPTLSLNNEDCNFVVSDYSNTTVTAAQNALLDAIDKVISAGTSDLYIEGGTYELLNCDLDNRPINLKGMSARTGDNPVTFKAVPRPLGSPTLATSVFRKAGSADYLRNISFENLVIDGNSANQSVFGNEVSAIQCGGMTNVKFINTEVKDGVNYAVFFGGKSGLPTLDSGTVTFTQGSTTVTGVGTQFESFVTEGFPLRSNSTGEESARVIKVLSDTQLILKSEWVHSTESGSEYVSVEPNSNCVIANSVFDKSGADDLFGGGFWYDSWVQGNQFLNGFGYGFGGTACDGLTVINNYAEGNRQGFGFERFYDCTIIGNQAVRNRSNGFYLINGVFDIRFSSNSAYENTDAGFAVALIWIEDAQKTAPKAVRFDNNSAYFNGSHGFTVRGASDVRFSGDRSYNNGQVSGSRYGFSVTSVPRPITGSPNLPTVFPDRVVFVDCYAFDDQATQTQVGGAFIDTGSTNVKFIGGDYSGNKTVSINDSGTSTFISSFTTV